MFYVSLPLGAVFAKNSDDEFHLIGMAIDADGVVTITEATDDLTADIDDYGPFCIMEMAEVLAKFAITPTTPMLPKTLVLDVPSEVPVPLDSPTGGVIDIIALTGGTFGVTVASSDTNVCTVAFDTDTITITPVAEGQAVITTTVADSTDTYADAVFLTTATVAKRNLVFEEIQDKVIEAGATGADVDLVSLGYSNAISAVDVYSSDAEIVAVTYADDGTNAKVGTITYTPHATQLGEVTITVKASDPKALNVNAELSFKVRVIAAE